MDTHRVVFPLLVLLLPSVLGQCADVFGVNCTDVVGRGCQGTKAQMCKKSCFLCVPHRDPCNDGDVGEIQVVANFSSCKEFMEQNDNHCEDSGSYMKQQLDDERDRNKLRYACSRSCNLCTVPTVYLITPTYIPGGATGQYVKVRGMCGGYPVYSQSRDSMYIYRTVDGYWEVSRTAPLSNSSQHPDTACISNSPLLRSYYSVTTLLDQTHQWAYLRNGMWVYDDAIRVSIWGCSSVNGCLQLNCHEPLKGYTCDECWVDHAKMRCEESKAIPLPQLMLIIMIIVVLVILVVLLLYARNHKVKTAPRSPPPDVDTSGMNKLEYLVATYRKKFLYVCGELGSIIAHHRAAFFGGVVTVLIIFTATGMPVARSDQGGTYSAEWAPVGGRLEREIEYTAKWSDNTKIAHGAVIMVGAKDGSSAITTHYLRELMRVYMDLMHVSVPLSFRNDTTIKITFQDFCRSIDHPYLEQFMNGSKPCMNPSVLDCFIEGAWQIQPSVSEGRVPAPSEQTNQWKNLDTGYQLSLALAPGAMDVYWGRPSFQNFTQRELLAAMSQYPEKCKHWATQTTPRRSEMLGGISQIKDGTGTVLVTGAKRLVGHMYLNSAKRARDLRVHLKDAEEREVERAINDWFDAISDRLEQINDDEEEYRGTHVSVYLSVSFDKMFSEIAKARFVKVVLGYVIMFCYIVVSQFSFDRTKNHSLVAVLGMLLVLLANLGAAGFLSLCGMVFNHTILQALPFLALGLGVDDMFLLLHYYSSIDDKTRRTSAVMRDLMLKAGVSVTLTSVCNTFAFLSGCIIPIPALRMFLVAASVVVIFNYLTMMLAFPVLLCWECDKDRNLLLQPNEKGKQLCPSLPSFQDFVEKTYSPLMQKQRTQLAITAVNFTFFVVLLASLLSFAPLDFGFNAVDLTPRGSYLSLGFKDLDEYLLSQTATHSFVLTDKVDLPSGQLALRKLDLELSASQWSAQSGGDVDSGKLWLELLMRYANQSNMSRVEKVDGIHIIRPEYFYRVLHDWRIPEVAGLLSVESQSIDGFAYRWGVDSYSVNNTLMMSRVEYSINKRKLQTTSDWLDHIDEYRHIMEKWFGKGNCFPDPSGSYASMEEFAVLSTYFWVAFTVATLVIFLSAMVVPVSIRGAALIAFTSALCTIEVAALLMLSDLSFSSMVAVVLLMSMGITVEFSAHIVAGFESTPGTRAERLHQALKHTVIPVLEGGVSSILSFSLLALSEFPYVFKYFFLVFFIVVILGLVHGLIFLPALIALVGSHESSASNSTNYPSEMIAVQGVPSGPTPVANPLLYCPSPEVKCVNETSGDGTPCKTKPPKELSSVSSDSV